MFTFKNPFLPMILFGIMIFLLGLWRLISIPS